MEQTVVPGSSLGDNRPTYIYKMVLLGSTSVGKSSLAYRYVKNEFKESLPTVGCSFFTQTIQLETATIKLEIWDTAGQEKYHSVCHLYYRGAHAALLVYDLTNKETLNRAKQWLMELEKEFLPDEIVIALVGNKTDLADEREVAAEDGEEFARSRSLLFMETSAKSNHQVNDIFVAVASRGMWPREKEGQALGEGCVPRSCTVTEMQWWVSSGQVGHHWLLRGMRGLTCPRGCLYPPALCHRRVDD
uniref:Ras-related protein Rab-17 n=1 Tax=Phasianus colchicus TaxID=9054 RepID=A0A669QCG4_PHACC